MTVESQQVFPEPDYNEPITPSQPVRDLIAQSESVCDDLTAQSQQVFPEPDYNESTT